MIAMEVRRYLTEGGRDVFGEWLASLKDARTRAKVLARIDRLGVGNFGDCKALGGGLLELKIDWGPGYRVYCALIGKECVLLLAGGDKRRQASDIGRARKYLEDYKERTL
jgi:putative addiction module killer protein